MEKFSLGEPEFRSTSDLKTYCQRGRQLVRPLANELRIGAEELGAALKEVPGLNLAQRQYRARIVSAHLRHAGEFIELGVGSIIRCYLSFERNFLHDTPEKSKRTFKLDQ